LHGAVQQRAREKSQDSTDHYRADARRQHRTSRVATTSSSTSSAPSSAPRASAPAPTEGRACLDRGSKITGKVSFEGPARIDGEVDGEISARTT